MKKVNKTWGVDLFLGIALILFVIFTMSFKVTKNPWEAKDLMPAKELADIINDPKVEKPLIISIGPSGLIKGAIEVGETKESENISKLKQLLSKLKKNKKIVVYCGCCPFKDCPNIRPAFSLLKSMQFENAKLLDLSTNLKVDWIDHNYPMAE